MKRLCADGSVDGPAEGPQQDSSQVLPVSLTWDVPPLPLVQQVLDHAVAGGLFVSLLCSRQSVVFLSVSRSFRDRMRDLRHISPRVTRVKEEIVSPLNLDLVLWLLSLPTPPNAESVLSAMAKVTTSTEVFDHLAGRVPSCSVGVLEHREDFSRMEWTVEEMRNLSNLMAICGGAVSAGNAVLFRWAVDRFIEGARVRIHSGVVDGFRTFGRPTYTGVWEKWATEAMRLGHWEVLAAVQGVLWGSRRRLLQWAMWEGFGSPVPDLSNMSEEDLSHAVNERTKRDGSPLLECPRLSSLASIDFGHAPPPAVLSALSEHPFQELSAAGLSFSVAKNRESDFIREGPGHVLWLIGLTGETEGFENAPPFPFPSVAQINLVMTTAAEAAPENEANTEPGQDAAFLSLSQSRLLQHAAGLVTAVMEAASCGGHSALVRDLYRKALSEWPHPESLSIFQKAIAQMGEGVLTNAAIREDFDLLNWLADDVDIPFEWTFWSYSDAFEHTPSSARVALYDWIKSRGLAEKLDVRHSHLTFFSQGPGRPLQPNEVARESEVSAAREGDVATLCVLESEKGVRFIDWQLCNAAARSKKWDVLRFLRLRENGSDTPPSCRWGYPDAPSLELRAFEILVMQKAHESTNPMQPDLPQVPPSLQEPLQAFIREAISHYKEVSFGDFGQPASCLCPLFWLPNRTCSGNVRVFIWLFEQADGEGKRQIKDYVRERADYFVRRVLEYAWGARVPGGFDQAMYSLPMTELCEKGLGGLQQKAATARDALECFCTWVEAEGL
uniref:Uncharacterized protein n=1 Tax=Chromera velia CCMP2878 TaxID=1169474 RepID=A0A0G4HYA2_9ALVE|eukprot:Cvel_9441.t1-p1 / transcript=Cvel_9441.t1 / gene=Cvel_9441 / organism=Chromera_velia_CCMP2878 / gene_product=hypothetical protein / transcript_product=hypothetical protein / location=Cvel_scaffold544:44485-46827(-) / protein_length=781 / sequence_SO=supercontig / SO=protein_coding / is_pseudo=false